MNAFARIHMTASQSVFGQIYFSFVMTVLSIIFIRSFVAAVKGLGAIYQWCKKRDIQNLAIGAMVFVILFFYNWIIWFCTNPPR